MENNKLNPETINDLIEIHKDRILGYEKAIDELEEKDSDLIECFNERIQESQQFKAALVRTIISLGGQPAEGSTVSGKIYRAWMDVKTAFTGHDRESILGNCEFGEDAAQKAYQTALETEGLSTELRNLLTDQQTQLQNAHQHIRILRAQIV